MLFEKKCSNVPGSNGAFSQSLLSEASWPLTPWPAFNGSREIDLQNQRSELLEYVRRNYNGQHGGTLPEGGRQRRRG